MESDKVIQLNVMAELEAVLSNACSVGVAVENGIVTLSGRVPNHDSKAAAEKAASRITGTHAVVDEIEVVAATEADFGDRGIAERAAALLAGSPVLDAPYDIVVEDGWVTLSGYAPSSTERQNAEDLVRGIDGVRGVSCALVVRGRT